MENQTLDAAKINAFTLHLRAEEHSAGTIEKYGRDISAFCAWNDGSIVTKQRAAEWKEHLLSEKYQPVQPAFASNSLPSQESFLDSAKLNRGTVCETIIAIRNWSAYMFLFPKQTVFHGVHLGSLLRHLLL